MAELLSIADQGLEGSDPIGWIPFSVTTSSVARSSVQKLDGNNSLAVIATATAAGTRSPLFTGTSEVLRASLFLYSPSGATFSLNAATTTGSVAAPVTVTKTIPAGVWTQLGPLFFPSIANQIIWIRQSGGVIETFYIDRVSIADYAAPPPPPPPHGPHTLVAMQAGLKAALQEIEGLRVYDFPSNKVETPAAVISLPETPYDVTLDGRSDHWTFPIWILVAKADDKASYKEMVPYIEAEGERSIRAALETDRTLGGSCDTCSILRARPQFATVGGVEFLAVEFTVEVYS